MAKNVYIFLADGFEDIEGLAVVDLMRRAGIRITTVSIMDKKEVVTSHHIALLADSLFDETDFLDADMLVMAIVPPAGDWVQPLILHYP